MKKKGFTLIELMAVVAIIGVLLGLIMSAAANSIKVARKQKTATICKVVTQGILTYREQKDQWPGSFNPNSSKSNNDGVNNRNNPDRLHLESSEIRTSRASSSRAFRARRTGATTASTSATRCTARRNRRRR